MNGIVNALVPLAACTPHPRNYNYHAESQLFDLQRSLRMFGQVKSIVVQATAADAYLIVAGHGLIIAAQREGFVELRADIIPADWPPAQVLAYLAADNEIARQANPDQQQLAVLVAELQNVDQELAHLAAGSTARVDKLLADLVSAEALPAGVAEAPVYAAELIGEAAFAYFRDVGFPYYNLPKHVCFQQINRLALVSDATAQQTVIANRVADTYHPERFWAQVEHSRSVAVNFNRDAALKRAIALQLRYGVTVGTTLPPLLSVMMGGQGAANFRPGYAMYLYRKFARPGGTVLDTSAGYGGRLVGFIASGIAGHYIGIDPAGQSHEGNLRMAQDMRHAESVTLINLPAEDVSVEMVGRCDFAFTSPPYFSKEHYSDEPTQSWKRYATGDAWRIGFLAPMLALQFAALKPGCVAALNIADVQIGGTWYPLVAWAKQAGLQAGFVLEDTLRYPLPHRVGKGGSASRHNVPEPVLIFRKPLTAR